MINQHKHRLRCQCQSIKGVLSLIVLVLSFSGVANTVSLSGDIPLSLTTAVQIAEQNRNEITAARARAAAAHQRPAVVSAPEDPMLQWSVDHYPYSMMDEMAKARYDRSLMIEQRFSLSDIRQHRRRAAEAQASIEDFSTNRTILDIRYEAARAFFMLQESRRMQQLTQRQQLLATKLVEAATARYSTSSTTQADVFTAETEQSRVQARLTATAAEISAAEVMLSASLGLSAPTTLPVLLPPSLDRQPPSVERVMAGVLQHRPELQAGQAAIRKAEAEAEVMRAMYRPMLTVGLGAAKSMADGNGAMLKIGISIPLWEASLDAGVAEADSMLTMATADLDAMQLMLQGEALAARAAVIAAQAEQQALQKQVLPRAELAVRSALSAYSAGQGNMLDVITTTRAFWNVETELVMADTALGLAWAKLERSMASPRSTP